jgi:hypothetical protein
MSTRGRAFKIENLILPVYLNLTEILFLRGLNY